MNYEEKYKEALKAVKELREANPSDDGIQNWVNEKFPELKESGDYDERIRKALIDGFKRYDYGAIFNGLFVREILPWLEKQGEQKASDKVEPFKWSEEDENILEYTKEAVINTWGGDTQDEILDWLENIKQRIGE